MSNPATITFKCSCGKAMKAKAEHAGRRVKCPQCQQPVPIPGQTRAKSQVNAAGQRTNGQRTDARRSNDQVSQQPPPLQAADPLFGPAPGFPSSAHRQQPPNFGTAPGPGSADGFPGQGAAPPGFAPPGFAPQNAQQAQPAGSMAAETCPSCGSFFPRSQPNCAKCRFSRALGKKIPYQSLAQPVARMQAPPVRPKKRSASDERFGMRALYMIGGLFLMFIGIGIGGLMMLAVTNSETGRVRLRAFFLPAMIIASGFGLMVKGISGQD